MIESSLGIVGAYLPTLRPLFTRKSTRVKLPEKALVASETASN